MESIVLLIAAMAGCALVDWGGNHRIRAQLRFLDQREQELTKALAALKDAVTKDIVEMDRAINSVQTSQIEIDRILPSLRSALKVFQEFNKTY